MVTVWVLPFQSTLQFKDSDTTRTGTMVLPLMTVGGTDTTLVCSSTKLMVA